FETLKSQNAQLTAQVAELTAAGTEKDGKITALEAAQIATVDAAWVEQRDAFCADLQKKGILVGVDIDTAKGQLDLARQAGKGEFAADKNPHLKNLKAYMLSQKPKVKVGAPPVTGVEAPSKDPAVIAKKAQEFQAKELKEGRTISMTDAVQHVMKESAE